LGVSHAHSREEHVGLYESPLEPYSAMVFTGSGLMGREVDNIHSSDFVIFVGGRSGTLGEFCIAYDEGKLIGVLRNSGGLSNQYAGIAEMIRKETGSELIEDADPERLLERCDARFASEGRPTSIAFEGANRWPS
jgi:predicted Rossmann-fold nucleotide-binding protein